MRYENRLVEVTLPDSSTNEFAYDGDKRRVSRKDASGDEKWFLYDGINILQDLATDGTVWTSYVQGIGIDKLISVSEWAGQTVPSVRYYHSDAIGSVRSLTNENENEVKTYAYDAWGKVTVETGTDGNEYKFTSRRWEEDLGLQYNRARFYDPETGRFITPDPLTGGPDDPTISYKNNLYVLVERVVKEYLNGFEPWKRQNRYVYVCNNPINFIDPLGLENAIYIYFGTKDFTEDERNEVVDAVNGVWSLAANELKQGGTDCSKRAVETNRDLSNEEIDETDLVVKYQEYTVSDAEQVKVGGKPRNNPREISRYDMGTEKAYVHSDRLSNDISERKVDVINRINSEALKAFSGGEANKRANQLRVKEVKDYGRSDTPSPPLLLHARGNGTT